MTTPLPNHRCLLCGGPNACAPARSGSFDSPCWCREVTVSPWARAQVAGDANRSCLCIRCAQLQADDARAGRDENRAPAAAPSTPER